MSGWFNVLPRSTTGYRSCIPCVRIVNLLDLAKRERREVLASDWTV